MLNGIDVSSWQSDIDLKKVTADFVIIKVTGGVSYVNPYWRKMYHDAYTSGKLVALYHYAGEYGQRTSGQKEAEFFLEQVKGLEGSFIPCLDWESFATAFPVSYALEWMDAVASATKSTPMFYSYASYVNDTDLSRVSSKYPLWLAGYPYKYDGINGYASSPKSQYGTGNWNRYLCWQYSSTAIIPGYGGRLDVNVFDGTKDDWKTLQKGGGDMAIEYIDVANVAATIHADMCEDAANGYSQSPRNGEDGLGIKKLTIGGRIYQYDRGSYDCASSIITACNEALRYTEHKDALKAATYTGNMRSVFKNSGLFDIWNTATTIAKRGDVYLNDANHTAMCQNDNPDILSEFSSNEFGGITGGKVGDQTGKEAYIHGFYEYPWNVTLHWKGKLKAADKKETQSEKLDVDGVLGPKTISELQRQLGVTVTKKMDKTTVKALQKLLNSGKLKK